MKHPEGTACQDVSKPLKVMGNHANITRLCRLFGISSVQTPMLIMAVCTHHHLEFTRLRGDIHHQRTSVKLLWLSFVLQESDCFCLSST